MIQKNKTNWVLIFGLVLFLTTSTIGLSGCTDLIEIAVKEVVENIKKPDTPKGTKLNNGSLGDQEVWISTFDYSGCVYDGASQPLEVIKGKEMPYVTVCASEKLYINGKQYWLSVYVQDDKGEWKMKQNINMNYMARKDGRLYSYLQTPVVNWLGEKTITYKIQITYDENGKTNVAKEINIAMVYNVKEI